MPWAAPGTHHRGVGRYNRANPRTATRVNQTRGLGRFLPPTLLAGAHEGWRVTLDADALRECDKVIATGTLVLNDSLDAMLARCTRARHVALIGPSMGCLPDALFARGVTLLGGSWIDDGAA